MPRLLAFLPCEKVVIAKDDNSPNLIGIFGGLRLTGTTIPSEDQPASLPLRWSAFTYWIKEPGDEGRRYEQRTELLSPTGKLLLGQQSEFVMTAMKHRQWGTVFGFPVTGVGNYVLRLSIRDANHDEQFKVIAEFPITIEINSPEDQTTSAPVASTPARTN